MLYVNLKTFYPSGPKVAISIAVSALPKSRFSTRLRKVATFFFFIIRDCVEISVTGSSTSVVDEEVKKSKEAKTLTSLLVDSFSITPMSQICQYDKGCYYY